ncbi:MAG: hypothetical protein R3C01_07305 [Planctomycetaceae bacterium]
MHQHAAVANGVGVDFGDLEVEDLSRGLLPEEVIDAKLSMGGEEEITRFQILSLNPAALGEAGEVVVAEFFGDRPPNESSPFVKQVKDDPGKAMLLAL